MSITERWSKRERIESLERRVAYLEQEMRAICSCPHTADGPRTSRARACLIHGDAVLLRTSEAFEVTA